MKKDLRKYKTKVDREIKKFIVSLKEKNNLTKACKYALLNGGKRIRPIIVLLISEALNKGFDVNFSAVAVELFHTASLIADDLPCMDDEKKRRKKPVLHKIFGESVAILSTYTFIASGYEMIVKNARVLEKKKMVSKEKSNSLAILAIEEMSKVSGIYGATNGQFLDLFPKNRSLKTILKIIKQKTCSLFEASFILGWLFGGGDIRKLEKVKKVAFYFGTIFQIADDICDMKKDKNKLNIAVFLGKEKAMGILQREILLFEKELKKLNIFSNSFQKIIHFIIKSLSL